MTEPLSFNYQPDPELGALIRASLDGGDQEQFVARLQGAVRAAPQETSVDVLSRWAPAGLVAAGIAAALVWFLARPAADPAGGTMLASAPVQMDLAPTQPETDVLVVSLVEGR
jgi:hypothetical protein